MADSEDNYRSDTIGSSENLKGDPRLDFYSETFDPILALRVSTLKVPDESAKKYDNLALYNAAIEEQKNPRRKREKKEEISKIEIIRRWLPEQSRWIFYSFVDIDRMWLCMRRNNNHKIIYLVKDFNKKITFIPLVDMRVGALLCAF